MKITSLAACFVLAGALVACDKPRSMGDPNEVLVVSSPEVWQALESQIKASMEPSLFTVRDERVFDVAHGDPAEPGWENLRVMQQLLIIGSPADAHVQQALAEHDGAPPSPPAIVQMRNVWALDQVVTVALVPEGAEPTAAAPLLPEIGQIYLQQFEEYARARMFVTEPDMALRDSLRSAAGFTLLLPRVYRYEQFEEGVLIFRNDQPDPSRLIRNITVASRPASEVEMTPEAASQWRGDIAARATTPGQVTQPLPGSSPIEANGRPGIQMQGTWSNPPGEWPAAGPFITRLINCGDRVFMVDAWLYAPGFAKYEYMFQLNTILDSFECG